MKLEIKQEFKDKIDKLMDDLGIVGVASLNVDSADYYNVGSRIPLKMYSFSIGFNVDVPDSMVVVKDDNEVDK